MKKVLDIFNFLSISLVGRLSVWLTYVRRDVIALNPTNRMLQIFVLF